MKFLSTVCVVILVINRPGLLISLCRTVLGRSKSQSIYDSIIGSKVTVILLVWWILPIGGIASGRVCAQPAKQVYFRLYR